MATGSDPYGQVETEAERQARLAAMARASGMDAETGGSAPMSISPEQQASLSGTPTYTNSMDAETGGSAPMSISPEQLDAMRRAIADTASRNEQYKNPMDAETGGSAPMSMSPEQQKALSGGTAATAATGGSLAGALTGATGSNVSGGSAAGSGTTGAVAGGNQITGTGNLLGQMTTQSNLGGAGSNQLTAGGAGGAPAGAGTGTIDQGGTGGGLGALTSSIVSQLQQIGQSTIGPNAQPDVTGVFLQQSQAILKMLDEQEAQLRAESEKQGTQIDPATQFTIDKMRESLNEQLKTTREDLNRRGLNDSGILLELENRLQKGSMSDQARVLAERLTKLQDQLSSGLSNIRNQKVSTLSSFGRDAANAQFTAGENQKKNALDREQSALQGMLNLRGQVSGENENSLQRSFQSNESALQRAYGEAQSKAQTTAEFEANRQKYEQELALIQARNAGGTSGTGGAARPATASATGAAPTSATQQAVQELTSVFTNATEANAAIKENLQELAAAGVDIAALYNAAQGLGGRRVGTIDY